LVAKVNRACFYRLVELAEPVAESLVLRAGNSVFVLGTSS